MNSQRHVVVVTGGRTYPRNLRGAVNGQLNNLYVRHGSFILFHGACQPRDSDVMTGADRYADDWAQAVPGIDLRRRPADWTRNGNEAGPIRNLAMIEEALQLAAADRIHGLAFPEPGSRGTWNCVRHMKDAGIVFETWDIQRSREWLAEEGAF